MLEGRSTATSVTELTRRCAGQKAGAAALTKKRHLELRAPVRFVGIAAAVACLTCAHEADERAGPAGHSPQHPADTPGGGSYLAGGGPHLARRDAARPERGRSSIGHMHQANEA